LDKALKEWGRGGGGVEVGIRELVEGVLAEGYIREDVLEGPISAQRNKAQRGR
jgi:hypothetical protein